MEQIQLWRVCHIQPGGRKHLRSKAEVKEFSLNLCGFLRVTRHLFAVSACILACQDEAAVGCCCSGRRQLCQHLSGGPGVPRLEAQVW